MIGRVFWYSPVCELLDGVAPDFVLLETRDFVRRRLGSALADEREFTFRHALTREVAYAGVPKPRRARLHAAFATWLERVGEGRGEHAALLAHHYAEAARPEDADLAWAGEEAELQRLRQQAVTWLGRAAALAIGRYELDEALAMLRRALELEPGPAAELGLWRAIGKANALRHDGDPFLTAMTRAIELAPDRETAAELYAELSFEAALRAGMWRRRPDREVVDGWIDRALELAEPESARPRASADRTLRLGSARLGRGGARGGRAGRAARRPRAALVRLGRPRDHALGERRAGSRAGAGGAALRAARPDPRSRPHRGHPLRPGVRLHLARTLQGGSPAGPAPRRDHERPDAPSPDPRRRRARRGGGARRRMGVDPGSRAAGRGDDPRQPRYALRPQPAHAAPVCARGRTRSATTPGRHSSKRPARSSGWRATAT